MDKILYTSRIVSAANTTNPTSAKASSAILCGFHGLNKAAADRYLKFYNKASAPTVGTDVPVLTVAIPASTAFAIDYPEGYYFSVGLAYALTVLGADSDATAVTAGDIVGLNVNFS